MKKQARKLIGYLSFLLGLTLLIYFVILSLMPGGTNFGIILIGIIGLLLTFAGIVLLNNTYISPKSQKILKIFTILFSIWLISFGLMCTLIISAAQTSEISNPDYLIILGAGLDKDKPTLTLAKRLTIGIDYLNKHPEVKVIVSGGQGIGETISEAEAMNNYLILHGIAEQRILMEPNSTSTMENYLFTSQLSEIKSTKKPVKLMTITSDFHLFRSKMLAKRNGFISGAIPSKTPFYLLPNSILREYFAIIKSFIFDR
ncbi:MAG: YdcF family protein [Eubacteriales bacterium]